MPRADTEAMQVHLDEIAGAVSPGAHAIVLLDQAGWHTTPNLCMPKNLTPVSLPPRSPELNPAENLWQFLRQTFLSNRVFETFEEILDAACDAWNAVLNTPSRIMSIGLRDWARTGQC
jgi:putative transposase